MNHYETRAQYAVELGEALANRADETWAKVAVLTARDSSPITGAAGGARLNTQDLTGAMDATLAGKYLDLFYEAAQTMDEKDVPKSDRFAVMPYEAFYGLMRYKKEDLIDVDVSAGNGNLADATMKKIAGMEIFTTNHLPTANEASGETGARNTYHADYESAGLNVKALAFQKQAFGTVELRGMSVESTWMPEYQGHLMIAKQIWGSKSLRPECAVVLESSAAD